MAFLNLLIPLLALINGQSRPSQDLSSAVNHGNLGCVACHHPHQPTGKVPLWQQSDTDIRFALYRSHGSLPGSTSLVCLGCHDGAIADEIPVETTSPIVSQVGTTVAVTNHRINDPLASHPIGIAYPSLSFKYASPKRVAAEGLRLPQNRVECISCHEPHGTTGLEHLLAKTNRRSALCLSCHQL